MKRWYQNLHSAFKVLFNSRGRSITALGLGGGGFCIYSLNPFLFTQEQKKTMTPPVYGWGNNEHKVAAPESDEAVVKFPTKFSFVDKIVDISAGDLHAAAVDTNGDLYQWGSAISSDKHAPVMTLQGHQLSQVVCCEKAVIAFSVKRQCLYVIPTTGDTLQTGGKNMESSIGAPVYSVKFAEHLSRWESLSKVAAGHDHFVLLGDKGSVLTGALNDRGNMFGQLGCGPTEFTRKPEDFKIERVKLLPDANKLLGMISGNEALTEDRLECTEPPSHLYKEFKVQKVNVPSASAVTDIVCGSHHTLLQTGEGRALGFGSNELLQIGLGHFDKNRIIVNTPVEVNSIWPGGVKPMHSNVTGIAASKQTSFFVVDSLDETTVYAVGSGLTGQLGNGSWVHAVGIPTIVQRISSLKYYDELKSKVNPVRCRYLTAGGQHIAAVMKTYRPSMSDGTDLEVKHGEDVYLWGNNRYFQLGLGGRHHNLSRPSTLIPFTLSSTYDTSGVVLDKNVDSNVGLEVGSGTSIGEASVDGQGQRLVLGGPLLTNEEGTVSFVGGQFQLLTGEDPSKGPIQRIYCGPDVTFIH